MKWKYTFRRYMAQSGGFMSFEYGVTVEIETPKGLKLYYSTGEGDEGGYETLGRTPADQFAVNLPGVVATQVAEGLEAYCKKSVEDLEEAVGVVFAEKVGYFGEEPLGVAV